MTSPIQESSISLEQIHKFLAEIYKICKTYEDFVQFTNIMELTMKILCFINSQEIKSQLAKIILQNTWKQIQTSFETNTPNQTKIENMKI
jgi:hypothetical protein